MTSIYKLIGIFTVFINFNYAAFDAIALIASKGCIPYLAIKAQKSIKRATISSVSLDSYESPDTGQGMAPAYEGLAAPFLPKHGLYQNPLGEGEVLPQSTVSFLPPPLERVQHNSLTADEAGVAVFPQREDMTYIAGNEPAVPLEFQMDTLHESKKEVPQESLNNEGFLNQDGDSSYSVISSSVPEFPCSSLVLDQSLFGALSKPEEEPDALNLSMNSSFTFISSVVVVSPLPSFGGDNNPPTAERAGTLLRRQSVANFDDIASSDDDDDLERVVDSVADFSFEGLVEEQDSNSLDYLNEGEFRETLVLDSDSDSCSGSGLEEEALNVFRLPTPFQGRLYRPEKMTVTFTKNNRRETVVRSTPAPNKRVMVRQGIMARSIINQPPLTPLNSVWRPLEKAESRDAVDRLREAGKNCLLPIRFEFDSRIQLEVVKIKPSPKHNGRLSVET
jgi:hypothetical protein